MKIDIKTKSVTAFLSSLLLTPAFTYASTDPTASPFAGANKGINIWSAQKLNPRSKKESMKGTATFATDGYNQATWTDEAVNSLFNIPKIAKNETAQYDKVNDPADTHLKSDISKIELSFRFTGIPSASRDSILGFAPAGGYKKGKGWDGIVEFVRLKNLGICSFTTFSIESVILEKELVEHSINKKPSEKDISGNWSAGFLYHVNWYTDKRRNSFQCASKELKPENLKEMAKIANQIDKDVIQAL